MTKLFFNGTILPQSGGESPEALAVWGSKISGVGTEADLRGRFGKVEAYDLKGGCLLPGFHDSHVHLTQHGLELSQLSLSSTKTLEEGLAKIAERAATLEADEWLLAAGYLMARWNVAKLTKEMLDAVAPHHPVFIRSQDHHSAWANSEALKRAGISEASPDPHNGEIVRDEAGKPTGLLLEHAAYLVRDVIPQPSAADLGAALGAAASDFASMGITTVHHMAAEPASYWQGIALKASKPEYGLRVWACIPQEDLEHAAALGLATGQGGETFQIGGAKFFADGALGSLTAHMLAPYEGTNTAGVALHGREVLRKRFPAAINAGLVPVTHAIGDAANRAVIDTLEETRSLWQAKGMRPRIEHVQHLHPDDIARVGALGVIASMQPLHLRFDATRASQLLADRLKTMHAWRTIKNSGATLAFGSDTPVAHPGVIEGLKTSLGRFSEEGETVHPEEALTLDEALLAYTRDAAYAIGWEERSGQLKEGYDADLVILNKSPYEGLESLEVTATMKGGRWTFKR